MNFDKLYIKIINYLPFLKKRIPHIELSGKEFRFIGKNLEYFPAEVLIGDEECGYFTTVACYYPNEFLKNNWTSLLILKHKGILARKNRFGKWEYIRKDIYEYEKVNYDLMLSEINTCLDKMPKMFDLNRITKHNTYGFKKYIVKTEYPEDKYYKVPAGVEFDALKIDFIEEWYIGDESRPTIGKNGDYLVVYNGNPIKFTEEEKAEMKWELVYDDAVDSIQMAMGSLQKNKNIFAKMYVSEEEKELIKKVSHTFGQYITDKMAKTKREELGKILGLCCIRNTIRVTQEEIVHLKYIDVKDERKELNEEQIATLLKVLKTFSYYTEIHIKNVQEEKYSPYIGLKYLLQDVTNLIQDIYISDYYYVVKENVEICGIDYDDARCGKSYE